MFTLSTKRIALLALMFFTVSVSACGIFFYTILQQKAELDSKVIERSAVKTQHDGLEGLMNKLESTKESREGLMLRILPENGVVDFLSQIESIKNEQGVMLKTDSLTIEPVDATFEKLVVTISVSGQYVSVLRVLELLEQLPYQSSIRKVSLNEEEKNGNMWKGVFELTVTKFKKI